MTLPMTLWAQSNAPEKVAPVSIFEALQSYTPGEGSVPIHQSADVLSRVGRVKMRTNSVLGHEGNVYTVSGFRIQAYTGNSSKSKNEVNARSQQIGRFFPELNRYISYKAPFWQLQVGDFLTRAEAIRIQKAMKEAIPSISRELYVIPEKVRIRNYNPVIEGGGNIE